MKDNKIDIMCQKLGMMRDMLNGVDSRMKREYEKNKESIQAVREGIEVLQTDLELLRKCSLDNPDFKWENQ